MKLKLCVKEPKSWVEYNFSKSMEIEQSTINFHQEILLEEVMNLPKREKKAFKIVASSFLVTAISFLALSSKSMAATLNSTVSGSSTALPSGAVGMPPELMHLMMSFLGITEGVGILLSAILLVSAGIMRMMGKKRRKEAEEWSVDIIKGSIQVLISCPLIFLLYYLASMILKSSGWFISPF